MASHDAAKTLAGKVALVTGAGRGLGRAFAEKLAVMGADVAIHGMRENGPAEYGEGTTLTAVAQEVGKQYGVRTQRVLGDLTKAADIARVIAESEQALGPIDILVHNAGGDIAAAGGKPNPNDAVNIKEEDVRAVLDRIHSRRNVGAFYRTWARTPRGFSQGVKGPSPAGDAGPAVVPLPRHGARRRLSALVHLTNDIVFCGFHGKSGPVGNGTNVPWTPVRSACVGLSAVSPARPALASPPRGGPGRPSGGANVVGCHRRFLSISRIYPGRVSILTKHPYCCYPIGQQRPAGS